jgi:hypothetical protein
VWRLSSAGPLEFEHRVVFVPVDADSFGLEAGSSAGWKDRYPDSQSAQHCDLLCHDETIPDLASIAGSDL